METDDPARAFHYGSHYSTAGGVLYYLIRAEPFTFLHSVLQGGKLDHADRLFNSLAATWHMCNTHSADVKELIPEFFCLPQMFENTNGVDFGTRQDGVKISDISLPPWAKGCPVEFVRVHKRALESARVSSQLHAWVDLIFGFKQRGKAAVEAVNVFHYLSYEGSVDLSAIEDEMERKSVTDHVLHFGQTPSQIFRKKQQPRTAPAKKGLWPIAGPASGALAGQVVKVSVAVTRVCAPGRAIRHCAIFNGRVFVIDQDALVHSFKWMTPRDTTSFTFNASSSQADFSVEFDKTSDLLNKQYVPLSVLPAPPSLPTRTHALFR